MTRRQTVDRYPVREDDERLGQTLELPTDVVRSIDDVGKDTTGIVESPTLTRHTDAPG